MTKKRRALKPGASSPEADIRVSEPLAGLGPRLASDLPPSEPRSILHPPQKKAGSSVIRPHALRADNVRPAFQAGLPAPFYCASRAHSAR
ncbi:hypothetical protein [Paenibacillus chitinolyticus]|uniref:hypothetical protein n=1 Tax=Paenibacillus chitinolyticus TaxID=79263 RepID=UPI003D01C011